MKYAGIIENDFAAAPGVSLTVFLQGCPHHCHGCHNPETWSFEGGKEVPPDFINKICEKLKDKGIKRNLCIMGGEPLCEENLFLTELIITEVRKKIPDQLIYVWTGYIYEDLKKSFNIHLKHILSKIDFLIDGPYIEEERTLTTPMIGSMNQKVIDLREVNKRNILKDNINEKIFRNI